jgi:hypothetical protein
VVLAGLRRPRVLEEVARTFFGAALRAGLRRLAEARLRAGLRLRAALVFRAVPRLRAGLRLRADARGLRADAREPLRAPVRFPDDREPFREPPRPAFFAFLAT